METSTNIGQQTNPSALKLATKYCLYSRKSSEDDERQALSIESQVKEMLLIAERENINVVEVRKESHSAKNSGQRPVFSQLISDIRSGQFDGILTWAPDRLSRNAGDLGSLVDLMDQGKLIEIRTNGQKFTNSPDQKFLLMILCSQAKLENDNRGVNVKRGQRAKLEMGHRPCLAPIGYINEKLAVRGKSRILIDPERAPLVKEMFNKVAYNFYTGRDLMQWCKEVGLTTRTGKKLTLSGIYRMLASTFYYGEFEWPVGSGNWFKGTHEPLITKELFQKARDNMFNPHRRTSGVKDFNFTRLITCGSCGSGITAEEKIKNLSDGTIKRYVYYHCTKFVNANCAEPFIREEDLLDQLLSLIDNIDLDEIGTKKQLQEELDRYQKFSQGVLGRMLEKTVLPKVDIRNYAKHILKEGNKEEKRELLEKLKSKLYLKNQKIGLIKERSGNRKKK